MTWSIDPRKFGEEVRITHRQLCQRIALDIDQRLVLATPVKSGRARSNWLPSVARPRLDQVDPRSDAEIVAEAQSVIAGAPEFPLIYLSNNLPYIQRLNDGSSKQAPAAFVETAIDGATRPFR